MFECNDWVSLIQTPFYRTPAMQSAFRSNWIHNLGRVISKDDKDGSVFVQFAVYNINYCDGLCFNRTTRKIQETAQCSLCFNHLRFENSPVPVYNKVLDCCHTLFLANWIFTLDLFKFDSNELAVLLLANDFVTNKLSSVVNGAIWK